MYENRLEPTMGSFRVCAYPAGWRAVAAAAFVASRTSLPAIAFVLVGSHLALEPATLVRWFILFFAVPALAAAVVGRAFTASLRAENDVLTIARAGLRVEIPHAAIGRIVAWCLPVPSPGFGLGLTSGRRLPQGIAMSDPMPVLRALMGQGVTAAGAAVAHPIVVYAHARAAHGHWRWTHLLARFPLFALGPTALLFNVHQHITYGGLLGQYYMLGLRPYVETFALYWATVTIYLVLYAAIWRGLAEPVCLVVAAVAPSGAARVRRATEWVIRVLYYGGVLALLALRFAPW
jgi:apolipoprotein N-acyltransferase